MEVMSVRIDADTRRLMEELSDVNWAEIMRQAVKDRLRIELELRHPIDRKRATAARRRTDQRRAELGFQTFSTTDEVRKWRDRRK
jgi:hypothetical protein